MIRLGVSEQDLDQAAGILKAGGLVAFPTETVYGLGADAGNDRAVSRVFAVKGRPKDHPLIVHLPSSAEIGQWARDVSQQAWRLADAFWPGPMTLVLARAAGVSDALTGGQDTIALRVPGHPVAHRLLARFGGGLAAPSANRFGRISPTTAEHVIAELDDAIDAVVDGGACEVGLESTIIDLSGPRPKLLRPGMLSVNSIENVLGEGLQMLADDAGPRVSGRLASHYAPETALERVSSTALEPTLAQLVRDGLRVAVMSTRDEPVDSPADCWIMMPKTPDEYARRLYADLRALDVGGFDWILVEAVPESGPWRAIADRLRRACR